jgi:hypothetical protein
MGQFPNCEIKLCDLEVARVIKEDEDIREIIGTPDYVGKKRADKKGPYTLFIYNKFIWAAIMCKHIYC